MKKYTELIITSITAMDDVRTAKGTLCEKIRPWYRFWKPKIVKHEVFNDGLYWKFKDTGLHVPGYYDFWKALDKIYELPLPA